MKSGSYRLRVTKRALLIALVTLLGLSGCATLLGGNVKGKFACSAPGGTCAPTEVIDNGALGQSASDSALPVSGSAPSDSGGFQRTALGAQAPLRTGERVLRIVFPPRVDRAGRYREAYAVHAVVNRSAWADARDPAAQGAARVAAPDAGLAALASSAPELALASAAFDGDTDPAVPAASRPAALSSTIAPQSSVVPVMLVDDAKRSVAKVLGGQAGGARAAGPIKSVAVPVSLVAGGTAAQAPNQGGAPLKAGSANGATGAAKSAIAVAAQPVPALKSGTAVQTIKATSFAGAVDTGGDK